MAHALLPALLLALAAAHMALASSWALLSSRPTSLMPLRSGAPGVYCDNLDIFVVFAGLKDNGATLLNDMWYFNFTSYVWQPIAPYLNVPSGRVWSSMVVREVSGGAMDTTTQCQVLMYGGSIFNQNVAATSMLTQSSELWVGDLNFSVPSAPTVNWTLVAAETSCVSSPCQVSQHSMVWLRNNLYLFGGLQTTDSAGQYGINYANLWKLTLSGDAVNGFSHQWDLQVAAATQGTSSSWPPARYASTMSARLSNVDSDDHLFLFGGQSLPSNGALANYNMLGDVWVYSFKSSVWYEAPGVSLQRSYLGSAMYNNSLFAFGGFTRVVENTKTSLYVFNDVLVLDFANFSSATVIDDAYPVCTASDGKSGLWCDVVFNSAVPQVRYDFASCKRRDQFVIFGGRFNSYLTDTWALNVTLAVHNLVVAPPDDLGGGDLQSTMYFMIAILTMMVVCFFVFVASLRRQRYNHVVTLIAARGQVPRPRRPVGARPEVIRALPMKKYHRASPDDTNADAENQIVEEAGGLHDMCAICLGDYEEGTELRVLPCAHFFHPLCIDQWLQQHNACPMCKAAVDLAVLDGNFPAEAAVQQGVEMTVVAASGAGAANNGNGPGAQAPLQPPEQPPQVGSSEQVVVPLEERASAPPRRDAAEEDAGPSPLV